MSVSFRSVLRLAACAASVAALATFAADLAQPVPAFRPSPAPARSALSGGLNTAVVVDRNGASRVTVPMALAPHANPAPAAQSSSQARVIVKLRNAPAPSLAQAAPSSGGAGTATTVDLRLQSLLSKHAVTAAAPLWTEHARNRAPAPSGKAPAAAAASPRTRFPARAARAPAGAPTSDLSSTYLLELGARSPAEVTQAVQSLQADPAVLWAEEDRISSVSYVPDDPRYASNGSWGQAYDDLHGLKRIGTTAAWDITQGQGVVVAIVDTGIDYNHPDISANIWTNPGEIPGNGIDDDNNGFVDDVRGWDFIGESVDQPAEDNDPYDGFFHGTHVAGTVAATGDNGLGVVGVAWKAKVMAVKALDDSGRGYDSDLARAIVYAVDNGADVINASFGGYGVSEAETEAVNYARANGVVFVAAAGNSTIDATLFSPANIAAAITVSSLSPTDDLSSFSNFGRKIDVAAPGEDILSLEHGTGGYIRASGTSMAAPHVSGLAALIIAQHPGYSTEQIRQALRLSAFDLGVTGPDDSFGFGRIDAPAALLLPEPLEAAITSPNDGTVIAAPVSVTGYAKGPNFDHYVVDYAPVSAPTDWTVLRTGNTIVNGGELAPLDPSAVTDGIYTVRLRVFNAGGQVFSHAIQLEVRYAHFAWPATPRTRSVAAQVKPGATYPITGLATGANFQNYRLEWAPGAAATTGWSTTGFVLAGGGLAPVANGPLAQWTVPAAWQGWYTIRLTVTDGILNRVTQTTVYAEAALAGTGWPQFVGMVGYNQSPVPVRQPDGTTRLVLCGDIPPASLYSYGYDGSGETTALDSGNRHQPAVGNLDGAPGDEIVVVDGLALKIFSSDLVLQKTIALPEYQWCLDEHVILEDVDNDGIPEIIFSGRNPDQESGKVWIYRTDGTLLSTTPATFTTGMFEEVRLLVVDLDGDGRKEIVVGHTDNNDAAYHLDVHNADGSAYAGWATLTFPQARLTSLAVADLDHDGTPELVCAEYIPNSDLYNAPTQVRVVNHDGTVRPGWPVIVDPNSRGWDAKVAIADLDHDQHHEIIVTSTLATSVLRADGSPWSAPWLIQPEAASPNFCTSGPPIIADLDGDGVPEILVSALTYIFEDGPPYYLHSTLRAFRQDGTLWRSWELLGAAGDQPAMGTPLVGDFNGDGKTDLAVNVSLIYGGEVGGTFLESALTCLTTGTPFNAAASDWPSLQHDTRNSNSLLSIAPAITTQPQDQTVLDGESVTFTAAASGTPFPTFQWLKGGVPLAGATRNSLTLTAANADNASEYAVVVTNALDSTTSRTATLTVHPRPVISLGTNWVPLAPGQGTTLTASATGTGPLHYQWIHNGQPVPGATGIFTGAATLPITNATRAAGGWYRLDVTDDYSTRHSTPIFVPVAPERTLLQLWDSSTMAPLAPTVELDDVIAISAGADYGLALRRNGSVAAWGANSHGETDVPADLGEVVAIACADFSLALKRDGTVVAWGARAPATPSGLNQVVAIAAGGTHALALKADGTVVSWGLGDGHAIISPTTLTDVVAVAAGKTYSLALKTDGTIQGWEYYGSDIFPALPTVTAIGASDEAAWTIMGDGSVTGWGNQSFFYPSLSPVTKVTGYHRSSLFLKADGTVQLWNLDAHTFSAPASLAKVVDIAMGGDFLATLRGSATLTLDGLSATYDGTPKAVTATTVPAGLTVHLTYNGSATAPTNPGSYAVVATIDDPAYSASASGTLVITDHGPVVTNHSAARNVLTPGGSVTLAVTAAATGSPVYQWYHDGRAVPAATGASLPLAAVTYADQGAYWVTISNLAGMTRSSPYFVLVAPATTQVVPWGDGSWEDFGQNKVPVGLHDAIAVADGAAHALALRADGTVIVWGSDDLEVSTVPAGLTNVVAVAAGLAHSYALKSDGTVVGWGHTDPDPNFAIDQTVPADLAGVVAIATKGQHALALKSDGTVRAWGKNFYGEADVPAGLHDVVAIAAGANHSMALKADGTVVVWGDHNTPWPTNLANITQIAAGQGNLLAVQADGTIKPWGSATSPRPANLVGVRSVCAGAEIYLAVKTDGTLLEWGYPNPPAIPAGASPAFAIAAGWYHLLAVRDAASDTPPTITLQPVALVRAEKQSATFSVTAAGSGPISFQWRKNGVPIDGATAATLRLDDLQLTDAGDYDVVAANHLASATSNAVTLTVNPLPVVTLSGSTRRVLSPMDSLDLAGTATGAGVLHYQWFHNGKSIGGATGSHYLLPAASFADSGWYVVDVTDDNGTRRSAPLFVTVAPAATRIAAWGDATGGATTVPDNLTDAIAVSAGSRHALALKRDGTVVAWGTNDYGQCDVPADLSNVVAVAAGYIHSLALKQDGTVVAWGGNWSHQCDVPAGLTAVAKIVATGEGSIALKADGTMTKWGTTYAEPDDLGPVVDVSSRAFHVIAVKPDGTVAAWGSFYQDRDYHVLAVPSGLNDAVAVSAHFYHNLALRANGTVAAWGGNQAGQLNVPAGLTDATAVAAGALHSLALRASGRVAAWGDNSLGQRTVPTGLARVFAISAGDNFSLALRDADSTPVDPIATTFALSATNFTYTGAAQGTSVVATPVDATFTTGGTLSATNAGHYTATATATGDYAGSNPSLEWTIAKATGTVTLGNLSAVFDGSAKAATATTSPAGMTVSFTYDGSPTAPTLPGSYTVVATINNTNYAGSASGTLVIADHGPVITSLPSVRNVLTPGSNLTLTMGVAAAGLTTYQWYHDGRAVDGATGSTLALNGATATDKGAYWLVITNAGGTTRSAPCFVLVAPAVTKVIAWGGSSYGVDMQPPSNLGDVVAISACGEDFVLALRRNGTVTGWGSNVRNRLSIPANLTDVVAIAAGWDNALALKSDGTLVTWGAATGGWNQIPAGTNNVVAIASGYSHAMALKTDGTVVAWGGNYYGEASVPAGLNHVVAIATGLSHSLAVRENGSVVAWGRNDYGESTIPANLLPARAVAGGSEHTVVLQENGTVVAFGWNHVGQTDVPAGLTSVRAIVAGQVHNLALRTDGTIVGWGANSISYGQATPPPGLAQVFAIAAGSSLSVVLRDATNDAAPSITSQPANQSVRAGQGAQFSVTAAGFPVPTYQWQMGVGATWQNLHDDAEWSGTATATLTIADWAVSALNGVQFRCVATNNLGSATSNGATLSVRSTSADFTGDGRPDILFENSITGEIGAWSMNGTTPIAWIPMNTVLTQWKIVATADFTGDGQADILFQNSVTGEIGCWSMNGTAATAWIPMNTVLTQWRIVAAADFTGDGLADILFQNSITGEIGCWSMNGTRPTAWIPMNTVLTEWRIVTAADFTGDGRPDILFQNSITGEIGCWSMNGTAATAWISMNTVLTEWHIVSAADFTGDGRPDILFQNSVTGEIGCWSMNGTTPTAWIPMNTVFTQWQIVNH